MKVEVHLQAVPKSSWLWTMIATIIALGLTVYFAITPVGNDQILDRIMLIAYSEMAYVVSMPIGLIMIFKILARLNQNDEET